MIDLFKKPNEKREAFKARSGASDQIIDAEDNSAILVAIYDVKAKELCSPPAVAKNEDVAIRDFTTLVNHPGNKFNTNPHDFLLHKLGDYNMKRGYILPCEPITVATGTDVYSDKATAMAARITQQIEQMQQKEQLQ